MTKLPVIGAPVTASGHPSPCGSTVSGVLSGSSSVKVDGTPIGIASDCTLEFGSHGHDVNEDGLCISYSSHSVQQTGVSSTLSVDGKAMYLTVNGAATDPGSGGSIDYSSSGGNNSVRTV